MKKKLNGNYTRMLRASPGGNTPQNRSFKATYHPSRKPSKLDDPDMRNTTGEVGMSSKVTCSCGPLHMDEQKQDDQLEPTYISSVPIRYLAQDLWTIEKGGKKGSGISVLMAWHDDDDDDS